MWEMRTLTLVTCSFSVGSEEDEGRCEELGRVSAGDGEEADDALHSGPPSSIPRSRR